MNNLKLQSRLPEIAAVLLAVVIAATVWLGSQYQQGVTLVRHTFEVQKTLLELVNLVRDMESSTRGYIISGDPDYLLDYERSLPEIPGRIANLKHLLADSSSQLKLVAELEPLIAERLEALASNVSVRQAEGLPGNVAVLKRKAGLLSMSKVREKVRALEENEDNLLRVRTANVDRLIWIITLATALGIVLVILSLVAWTWSMRRDAALLAASSAERQLAEAQLRQVQKIEAIGQLTGGIAHDFNNKLAVIISGLSLIKRRIGTDNAGIASLIDATMDGAQTAVALTSRLMTFARRQSLEPKVTDANNLIKGMADLVNRSIGEAVTLKTKLLPGLWLIRTDAAQLESAIVNLCVNARDALPDGGSIIIETANAQLNELRASAYSLSSGDYVSISVKDNGSGMTPDVLDKAFDPFFTTKEVGKGTGLGLSQVHGFVKQSHGHVRIDSEPGLGTTVTMLFPRTLHEAKSDDERTGPSLRASTSKRGGTVLVVEDDERVRQFTVSMLHELKYEVLDAESARAALRILEQHPDTKLMITDVVMPELDGNTLAKMAREKYPDLKVLFCSGFVRSAEIENGHAELGDFIAKPFTLEQLSAKVEGMFSQTSE
jgi:signal transduction histidine kinase